MALIFKNTTIVVFFCLGMFWIFVKLIITKINSNNMKKLSSLVLLALLAITSISCNNDDAPAPIPVIPPAPSTALFRYSENAPLSISTNIIAAATASFSTQFNTLTVFNAAGTLLFEINLTAATLGTYTVNSSNVISYTAVNPYFIPSSGDIIITANASGKISGTFSGLGSTNPSGVSRIYGEFNNVNIVP